MGNKNSKMDSPSHKIQPAYDPVPPYDLEEDIEANGASFPNPANANANNDQPIELQASSNVGLEVDHQKDNTRSHRHGELSEAAKCCFGLAYFSVACFMVICVVFFGNYFGTRKKCN
jgi:hypothetical protein